MDALSRSECGGVYRLASGCEDQPEHGSAVVAVALVPVVVAPRVHPSMLHYLSWGKTDATGGALEPKVLRRPSGWFLTRNHNERLKSLAVWDQ